jgi:hypothetical protein
MVSDRKDSDGRGGGGGQKDLARPIVDSRRPRHVAQECSSI